jgi:uncharacterized protein YndB with AHSA1/START domain
MQQAPQQHETFSIERSYRRKRSEVWAAWSIREKKAAWLQNSGLEMDFRPGGFERAAYRDAMGEHVNETRYFEIRDNERIVLAYSMAVNGRVHTVSLTTIAFLDENAGTRLVYTEQMCVIPPSDGVEGRRHGWGVLLDKLGDHLAKE